MLISLLIKYWLRNKILFFLEILGDREWRQAGNEYVYSCSERQQNLETPHISRWDNSNTPPFFGFSSAKLMPGRYP